jgi:toxin FitB
VKYLLDTSFVSELSRTPPDDRVEDWLASQDIRDLGVSALTVAEILRGIARLGDTRRAGRLAAWFEATVQRLVADRVLPFGPDEARRWADLMGRRDREGQPLPVIDSLIAATARAHDLSVVTRNVADFERCGVPVISPWSSR